MESPIPNILVSTTDFIPGYQIVEYRGVAFGVTVRSRGVGGDCKAGCESVCGGEVTAYTEMAIDSRDQAIQRMVENATRMGANAVIGIMFDSDQIGSGANNATIVYGTAVVVTQQF
jgi:uncharacterized protein YbjQ (UPF0145 family)